jgi:hypothetical protein
LPENKNDKISSVNIAAPTCSYPERIPTSMAEAAPQRALPGAAGKENKQATIWN